MEDLFYLSKMRRYRGQDEAVKILQDRQNLVELLKDPSSVSREELMGAVISCYCGKSYGDSNWSKVSGGWTTPEVPTLYGTFRDQHEQLAQLSLDPGFLTHLPEFFEFLKTNDVDAQTHAEVRKKFKQYLGERTVWRGMMLTEEEANRIKQEGIASNFLRETQNMPALIENFEANTLSVYFNELVECHFHGENYHSPIVSVTDHKDVAMAVGKHFVKKDSSRELYLFQIRIPEIDLFFYTDHAVRVPSKLQDVINRGANLHISVNGRETSYPWNRSVESYILHKINPEEIIEISKPAITQSSWRG